MEMAKKVYRPDIYAAAAKELIAEGKMKASDFPDFAKETGFKGPQERLHRRHRVRRTQAERLPGQVQDRPEGQRQDCSIAGRVPAHGRGAMSQRARHDHDNTEPYCSVSARWRRRARAANRYRAHVARYRCRRCSASSSFWGSGTSGRSAHPDVAGRAARARRRCWSRPATCTRNTWRSAQREAAFYERQEARKAEFLAQDPGQEFAPLTYTGKPTYVDQIFTSL